ncbi:uncharacterized protein BX663DRAFT_481573 [Cokeromyces recurvatus]|uniref:uncharacterized protein n=1 Tax=Cokeromyces recurvatus TaxID=90255 RepID=UPI00221F2BD5|nr:uncharacterized protein BX663DRAFT_481573 [Cokeromyces recurvatus]KAI7897563.1 hypothetical protein BX663DRAFT_481573 [Cokeromyces recurvatus]
MGMLQGKKRPLMGFSKSGIVDSKSKTFEERLTEVMALFYKQTQLIPIANQLPKAALKNDADLSVYNTPTITKHASQDIQLLWSLAIAIFRSKKTDSVQQWLRDLVQPGMQYQLERYLKAYDDPFVAAFIYLTFGQRKMASDEARKLKDTSLSIYIIHSEFKSMSGIILNQIEMFKSEGQWQQMSVFHRKCWLLVAGRLGYEYDDKFAVTEGIYWQCVLGMYVWFGKRHDDNKLTLEFYNQVFDKPKRDNLQLKTAKYTAKPDYDCYWFQLLQWWIGDHKLAHFDEWPLDFVWLLSMYTKENNIDLSFSLKWIDQLEHTDLVDWAIYASLFLPSPTEKLNYILRQCEWTDERRLVEEYHIPYKQIQIAKALNAHDSWNFESEYTYLIQGQLYNEAKMALFFFLLPKLYRDNDKNSLQLCLKYMDEYSQADEEIELLKDVYTYLTVEGSNNEQGKEYISKLQNLQKMYGSRSMKDLLSSLIHEIELK